MLCGEFEMCCLFQIPSSCFETLVNIKLDMRVRCETFSSQVFATTSNLGRAEIPEVFLCRNAQFASSAADDD